MLLGVLKMKDEGCAAAGHFQRRMKIVSEGEWVFLVLHGHFFVSF